MIEEFHLDTDRVYKSNSSLVNAGNMIFLFLNMNFL